ncbi:MarR family winged helix-turn-helix transcriptional regulator [Nocardia rhizosphaerae]|uniref:MarR family winged helix-turn-helix transcriptional regulator n=1 Tax=Nocardia rhizosphaerae TaxID=1691571 RepID=A0ABV8L3H5_9NOCA
MHMKPTPGGAQPADVTAETWFRATTAVTSVNAQLGAWLTERHRVSLSEYRALRYLSTMPDLEARVSELAHRIDLNQSSVTRLLGRLEARGLTRRDLCSEDGRGVYAVLTDAGQALVRDAREPFLAQLERALQDAGDLRHELDTLLPAAD